MVQLSAALRQARANNDQTDYAHLVSFLNYQVVFKSLAFSTMMASLATKFSVGVNYATHAAKGCLGSMIIRNLGGKP